MPHIKELDVLTTPDEEGKKEKDKSRQKVGDASTHAPA